MGRCVPPPNASYKEGKMMLGAQFHIVSSDRPRLEYAPGTEHLPFRSDFWGVYFSLRFCCCCLSVTYLVCPLLI